MTSLENLDLRKVGITDKGLEYLKGLRKLKEIYLKGTKVSDAGVRNLHQALPRTDIVR